MKPKAKRYLRLLKERRLSHRHGKRRLRKKK